MDDQASMTSRIRFGLFEFDPATGELWREGVRVRLQHQPARVLALLVARPGSAVTRDELRQAIWGDETFVDFERGLNFCVAQIRAALGDAAESPRFVETLPKRGYRFIAPVGPAGQAPAAPPAPPETTIAGRSFQQRGLVWIMAGLFLTAAAGWLWLAKPSWMDALMADPRPRLAVVPFDNETGSARFDVLARNLTDALVTELTQRSGGQLGVIGNAAVLQTPRSFRDLEAIAATLDAGHIVLGQIQREGSRLRITAHLIRANDQTHLWAERYEHGGTTVPVQETVEQIAGKILPLVPTP